MKIRKTTRVSFSDNPPTLDIKMPTKWTELSDDELRLVFRAIDTYTDPKDNVPFHVFRCLAGMRIERQHEGRFLCSFSNGKKKFRCWLTPEQLSEHLECLAFLSEPGNVPVRLNRIGYGQKRSYQGVNPQLHNVSFLDYVKLENLYQGFLRSKAVSDILKMASILYPGFRPEKDRISAYEGLSIIQWLMQVKGMFAKAFPHFFKPCTDALGGAPSMVEVMNNEIRALTNGDVSKEAEIFDVDCWRCLTELDFKAREAEEFNRLKNKNK